MGGKIALGKTRWREVGSGRLNTAASIVSKGPMTSKENLNRSRIQYHREMDSNVNQIGDSNVRTGEASQPFKRPKCDSIILPS